MASKKRKLFINILESIGSGDLKFALALECDIKVNVIKLEEAFNVYADQQTAYLQSEIQQKEARIAELEEAFIQSELENSMIRSNGYEQLLTELDYVRSVEQPAAETELQSVLACLNSLMDLIHEKVHPANYLIFESRQFKAAEELIRNRYTPPKREVNTSDDLPF